MTKKQIEQKIDQATKKLARLTAEAKAEKEKIKKLKAEKKAAK